jgi:translation elongation factor EF-G
MTVFEGCAGAARRRYDVKVNARAPAIGYRETIRRRQATVRRRAQSNQVGMASSAAS